MPLLRWASSTEEEENDEQKIQKGVLAHFCKSLQLCILRTLTVSVGTKALVEYVYGSKMACNCRIWEF